MSGSGTQVLAGSNTYTGSTTISRHAAVGHRRQRLRRLDQQRHQITNNSALVFNLFGNQTYAGAISGSGSLTKTGGGLLLLGNKATATAAAPRSPAASCSLPAVPPWAAAD